MGTFKKFFLLFLLCSGFSLQVKSAHIVGGEITYECLGDDNYRFTMRIYRDCFSGGAPFDPQAAITIYAGNDLNINDPFARLNIPVGTISRIAPNISNPCLIPPNNICVEEGVYTFTAQLPFNPSGYHVSYQRCCRNETINNIFTPGDVGATYTTFVTPEALDACNNSPTFNDFPPIVICTGELINFDHAATDVDGDMLVYRFCSPITGGGLDGVDNDLPITGPTGVSPDPATPPPYAPVGFIGALYSIDQPLGAPSMTSLGGASGLLDGIPTITGQFVVGICVDEFRNGVLLSSTRREFQFNVVSCERTIIADIQEDVLLGPRSFLINSCGDSTFTFINESRQQAFIDGYEWSFDLQNGDVFNSSEENPTVTFPGVGEYQGILVVNPGNQSCTDTAEIFVNIFPEVEANFSFFRDSCLLGPVEFTDLSFTGADSIVSYLWEFGDGGVSTEVNPDYQFIESGNWPVSLTVVDNNGCSDQITIEVPWFPSAVIDLDIQGEGCQPVNPFSANNSFPTEGYEFLWDFGDGNSEIGLLPDYTYEEPGVYDVMVTATSPLGCVSERFFPEAVTVFEVPVADFEFSPQELTNFASTANFMDLSIGASAWDWSFGNGDFSNAQNPTYEYPDTGMFNVQLIVTHPSGCMDTIVKPLDVVPRYTYFLPNAFTPNFDGRNDGFRGAGSFFGIEAFEMTIWNRWGELIFQTNDPNTAWNGQKNNTGKPSPQGVYVYLVDILGNRGEDVQLKGFVTLVR